MKILYIHQYYCPIDGVGNNRSYDFTKEFRAQGHDVTVITTTAYFPNTKKYPYCSTIHENGVKVIVFNIPYHQTMPYWRRIIAFLHFFIVALLQGFLLPRYDIVYASSTPPTVGYIGWLITAIKGGKFFFEVVDVWPDVPIGLGIINNKLLINILHVSVNFLYHKACEIVTLSDGMKNQILTHLIPLDKIIVIENGTDVQAFKAANHTKIQNEVVVVYTGAVGLANGVQAILEVADKARQDISAANIQFKIYGWGNEFLKLQEMAKNQQLENVHFMPPVPKSEVSGILINADIGILTFAPFPVLEANSANKFFDYLAAGLPIIINYEGWQAEVLKNYNCGLSSPMNDIEQLYQNIKNLSLNPALRLKMGKNARLLCEQRYNRSELAKLLLHRFEQSISSNQY